ncbi:glycosyltransferase family 2 protein [Olleya sp. 1-3]|uniref:glycosyltransferase family 2 protein n=1 Tax=Olleya sp. 1-3 TaxID=2058323 RepID=UPI000C3289BB|nr:glycosyltransferase family 2 protein [Olleya sp. 1-3]PKG51718.1 hypothetical protein CXF54_06885 [Olleya sp. 1-3]
MKSKQPLISVILPVYNVERYVKEAMDSILNQTVQDFEILVIDDCSTDNTLVVIEAIEDSRIKIIKKEANKGLIDSLNLGFSLAKGKYIARMDGDDINELTRFEKQFNVLESNHDVIACGSWIKYFGGHDKVVKHSEKHDAIVAQMLVKCPMSLGCCMLRTSAVLKFSFNADKVHVEDYDFWTKIAWEGKLYNLQEVLYHYRSHDAQVSHLYRNMQAQGDVLIQLFLFKKLKYDQGRFNAAFLTKFIQKKQEIKVEEFELFLEWLKTLTLLNEKSKVFEGKELDVVLNTIKITVINNIFFNNGFQGIDKKWRKKAFFKLEVLDFIYVFKRKISERIKIITNG